MLLWELLLAIRLPLSRMAGLWLLLRIMEFGG